MSREEVERIDDLGIEAWNAGDADAFVGLLSDDFVWSDVTLPEPMRTKEQAKEYFSSWGTAFPDMRVKLVNRVVSEDAVGAELEFTGTNTGPMKMGDQEIPPTGKSVVSHGAYFAKVRGGKIAEFSTHPDVAGVMMQLGLTPQM